MDRQLRPFRLSSWRSRCRRVWRWRLSVEWIRRVPRL